MTMAALVYPVGVQRYDYGSGHPLRMIRLRLTHELLKAFGVFDGKRAEHYDCGPCTREEAEAVHTPEYLDVLAGIDEGIAPADPGRYGLGYGDNPSFRGVYAGSMLAAGASLKAARLVESGHNHAAFNIAGGLHHAMPDYASGFCFINDPAVAIHELLKSGRKVAYVDIDAHHGDGVQAVFYDTDQVLTISIHESGGYLFPGTGSPDETGEGKGRGCSVNLPLAPGTGDEVFTWGFFELVPPLIDAYKPDVIVTQLGCDSFASDPLTHLRLTTNGFEKMVRGVADMKRPWVALGGGGYDVTNVARAWSLAFSVMAGIDLPDELPEGYKALLKKEGLAGKTLRDHEPTQDRKDAKKFAEKALLKLKHEVFPKHGIR